MEQTGKPKTEAPENTAKPGSEERLVRLPVKVTIYDADMKGHEVGPIWVEIQEQVGTCPWNLLANEEAACEERLKQDIECTVDFDAAREANK